MPQISIILPVYNAAPTLRPAMQSIMNQTVHNIEILAVTDASEDGSEDILHDMAAHDARLRIVPNTGRKMLAAALNVGLQQAVAPYVARMDADDLAAPDRLERQLAFLTNHSDVAICGTGAILIDESGNAVGHFSPPRGRESMKICAEYAPPLFHPTWMARTEVMRKLGGYREISNAEDYDLLLRALSSGYSIDNCDFDGLQYRLHANHRAKLINHKAGLFVHGMYRRRLLGEDEGFSDAAFRAAIGNGELNSRERVAQTLMVRAFDLIQERTLLGWPLLLAGLALSPASARLAWRRALVKLRLKIKGPAERSKYAG